ncbi:MAG: TrkH family potassium uptake protein [Erysipelotrichaceae bacterium]|nr:TrkH family potassium uptake protein [Erysipelotrichaceae bacterium]
MKRKYYRLIFYYLSIFIMMIGVLQLLPLIILPFYPQESVYLRCFLVPGIAAIAVGALLRYLLRDTEIIKLDKHYDAVLIVLIWILAILISTVPWMMTGYYNFSQASFEMTSGFSTTGLSVVDSDSCPKIFLFFRNITLLVGGVGLVLILTCAMNDRYGLNLYNADGHSDRLLPNLAKTARVIFAIYIGYIVLGTVAYVLAGMSFFDAFNTAIAAISTGGFSTRSESIYAYHSLPVEIITIVLMMLGQTNFFIHYSLIKGRTRPLRKHCETRFFIFIAVVFISLMTYNLLQSDYTDSLGESLRVTAFHFATSITTTGFVGVKDMSMFPSGFATAMILLMLIGGDLESTGGGIKQYRVIVALKGIYHSIRDLLMNRKIVKTNYICRIGKKVELSDDEISSTTSYVLFYILLFFLGSFIFAMFGYNLQDAMFEFASALSTVGLSLGITGYNAHPVILWTGIVGMFFGRLEIMVIFRALLRGLKDIQGREN